MIDFPSIDLGEMVLVGFQNALKSFASSGYFTVSRVNHCLTPFPFTSIIYLFYIVALCVDCYSISCPLGSIEYQVGNIG